MPGRQQCSSRPPGSSGSWPRPACWGGSGTHRSRCCKGWRREEPRQGCGRQQPQTLLACWPSGTRPWRPMRARRATWNSGAGRRSAHSSGSTGSGACGGVGTRERRGVRVDEQRPARVLLERPERGDGLGAVGHPGRDDAEGVGQVEVRGDAEPLHGEGQLARGVAAQLERRARGSGTPELPQGVAEVVGRILVRPVAPQRRAVRPRRLHQATRVEQEIPVRVARARRPCRGAP